MDELPTRFRVARAHANLSLDAAGKLVGMSGRQWSRYEAGEVKTPPNTDLLAKIADKLKVPDWYMRGGWSAASHDDAFAERVVKIEAQIVALRQGMRLAVTREVSREVEAILRAGEAPTADDKGAHGPGHPPEHREGGHL